MKKIFSLFALCIFTTLTACTQADPQTQDRRIERIENGLVPSFQIEGQDVSTFNIDDRLAELGIPGLSVAFASDGKMEWARAYGMADIAENEQMTTETMLLAGSISKPVAALRAHQLVENDVFDLDENVNAYLTSWTVPDNEFTENEKVTLRRILNHTAGLTVWGFPGYDKGDEIPSVPDVLDGKGNTDAVRVYKEPGESWQYSGGGYTIMQLMIEDLDTSPSFPETMQTHVLDRLKMQKSTFGNPLPEVFWDVAATGYRGNGNEVEGKWPIYPEMAAAGLWTTPSQLIQYAIEVQRVFQSQKDGLLTYNTIKEMLTPGMNGHGLGPGVSEHTFGHGGADEGFRAQLIAWKDKPYALVIMVNSDNGSIIRELMLSVAKEYDLPGVEPSLRTPIPMTKEELQKYAGSYSLGEFGLVEVSVDQDKLKIVGSILDEPAYFLAESESTFFDIKDGMRLKFDMQDDIVVGFDTQGISGTKEK